MELREPAGDENGIDTSSCFVPEILIDLLTKQISQSKATVPTSHIVHGVCLLVDISGFTKLSGDFCKDGKNGIDGLQLSTNGYMGKLVETIYMFGGDIIKFAGDAIICLFPTTLVTKLVKTKQGKILRRSDTATNAIHHNKDASVKLIKPDVLLRAMYCANILKTIVQGTLTVHVAISCGKMCFGVLGGFEDRWECLISGPCLQELSACLDDASSMQAVMTAGCFDVLRRGQRSLNISASADDATLGELIRLGAYHYSVAVLPSGNYTIVNVLNTDDEIASAFLNTSGASTNNPPLSPKGQIQDDSLATLVMQFVPAIVASGIKQGTGLSYLSEIREVTTMFMKWDAFDVNLDLIELQGGFYRVQRILHSTGAYLRQFLVDDKGCVLIACWGMPSQAYLDNAHRALTAAVEIRTALLEMQMKCSFGITTGDVYCGTVGSALRMEYAAIGSVVNMAARLMGKACGGILIDEPTFLRLPTAAQLPLEKLTPLQVKGRADPIQVYAHCGVPSSSRSTELATGKIAGLPEEDIFELRDCCREPLTALLDRLAGRRTPSHTHSATLNMLLTSMSSVSTTTTPGRSSRPTSLTSVLVEGKKGTGRKTSTGWLRKHAQQLNISTAQVKLSAKTNLSPFYLLHKIFAQLGPKDLYRDMSCQRRHVLALLKEVYPDDADKVAQVAFPIMQQALTITCTYSSKDATAQESSTSMSITSLAQSQQGTSRKALYRRSSKLSDKKFPASQMTEVMVTIFTHLLMERTVLVIIDDIHHADEESLRVLVELLKITDSKSAIVMSAAMACSDGHTTTETASTVKQASGGAESVPLALDLPAGAWASCIRPVILSNKITTVITVGAFTTTEIAAMLCTLPDNEQFPPDLPLLVQALSGGEFASIKEILRFLRDFGAARLLSIMEDNSLPTTTAEDIKHLSLNSSTDTATEKVTFDPSARTSLPSHPATKISPRLKHHRFKIDQLMVCRYENLHLSTKHILRTASIIGRSFQRQVLYGVLPRSLKAEIADCLHTLVQHQWLEQSAEDPELYEFRHDYSHQIIYNITPESERRNQHKVIADYIDEISPGDASQAAQLSYHYGMCDTDKALYYTYVAASSILESCAPLEMCDCIDLLSAAVPHCTTLRDVEVLRMLTTRAIAKTREFSAPPVHFTYRVMRTIRRMRFFRFLPFFCSRNSQKIVPAARLGENEYNEYFDGGGDFEGKGEESRHTVVSHNVQARDHFLALLHHLKHVLEQRKLTILQQPRGVTGRRL